MVVMVTSNQDNFEVEWLLLAYLKKSLKLAASEAFLSLVEIRLNYVKKIPIKFHKG